MEKPEGAALVTYPLDKVNLVLSAIDYHLWTKETDVFWRTLFKVMGIGIDKKDVQNRNAKKKEHDLLMDGPTD